MLNTRPKKKRNQRMSKCLKGCLIFYGKVLCNNFLWGRFMFVLCVWMSVRVRIYCVLIGTYTMVKRNNACIAIGCWYLSLSRLNLILSGCSESMYREWNKKSWSQWTVKRKKYDDEEEKKQYVHGFEWWCLWAITFIFQISYVMCMPKDIFFFRNCVSFFFIAVIGVGVIVNAFCASRTPIYTNREKTNNISNENIQQFCGIFMF